MNDSVAIFNLAFAINLAIALALLALTFEIIKHNNNNKNRLRGGRKGLGRKKTFYLA